MRLLKRILAFVMDILETVAFVGSILVVIYLFIMQPNQVKGSSMVPTFQNQDYILTSKITYKFRAPKHGDVVVFESPEKNDIEFIKRIIGLPGDQVMVAGADVYVNGRAISEPYIAEITNLWDGGFLKDGVPVIVPEGHLFVMGDNRPRSSDSRQFGFIDQKSIIGVVFYRYFPADKMGFVENPLQKQFNSSSLPRESFYYVARS